MNTSPLNSALWTDTSPAFAEATGCAKPRRRISQPSSQDWDEVYQRAESYLDTVKIDVASPSPLAKCHVYCTSLLMRSEDKSSGSLLDQFNLSLTSESSTLLKRRNLIKFGRSVSEPSFSNGNL